MSTPYTLLSLDVHVTISDHRWMAERSVAHKRPRETARSCVARNQVPRADTVDEAARNCGRAGVSAIGGPDDFREDGVYREQVRRCYHVGASAIKHGRSGHRVAGPVPIHLERAGDEPRCWRVFAERAGDPSVDIAAEVSG